MREPRPIPSWRRRMPSDERGPQPHRHGRGHAPRRASTAGAWPGFCRSSGSQDRRQGGRRRSRSVGHDAAPPADAAVHCGAPSGRRGPAHNRGSRRHAADRHCRRGPRYDGAAPALRRDRRALFRGRSPGDAGLEARAARRNRPRSAGGAGFRAGRFRAADAGRGPCRSRIRCDQAGLLHLARRRALSHGSGHFHHARDDRGRARRRGRLRLCQSARPARPGAARVACAACRKCRGDRRAVAQLFR